MTDFETVREMLGLFQDETGVRIRTGEALAALDRIEAEVERLGQRVVEAETRPALSQRIKEREAEVERLRAIERLAQNFIDALDRREFVTDASVELRAALARGGMMENDGPDRHAELVHLRGEVERLRANYDAAVGEAEAQAREVERLQEAVDGMLEDAEWYKAEVERLQTALENVERLALRAGGGGEYGGTMYAVRNIARAALAKEEA